MTWRDEEGGMSTGIQRDFVGYGATPPNPKWPGGARLALNFVMNYEEGSEPSIQDGEGFTETGLTEGFGRPQDVKGRDLAGEGMFEYGSRVGFWRLMRTFQERGLPMTVFGCALALERNPPAARAVAQSGFDLCCHGWRWVKHFALTEAEEREHIAKAVHSLAQTVGERPLGWYCRYGPSVNTRRLLVEEGGFLYDSDSYNDELPYWRTVAGRPHLVVPYSLTTNDGKYVGWMGTSDEWFAFLRDGFDVLYREGARAPKMMSVGLHMRVVGHPARAAGLQRFLDYVTRHPGVWITRRIDIARHWIATHPYPGQGLNE
ncbi:MAG: allantoinase PuuE [Alphaproteobacteria bacterium]|nr:allantoinase PuuE [Alphaproteobacteria bacterium]